MTMRMGSTPTMIGSVITALAVVLAAGPQAWSQSASLDEAGAVLGQYCATCHSSRLQTAGLTIEPGEIGDVESNREVWEKVVHKLRTRDMPPANAPRPDDESYDRVASYLEAELDRVARSRPRPGALPLMHRLTRTEYRNAIRDLLALEDLPGEMDYELLLPPDNAASGFDNLAELLFVAPSTMERYLEAARKISRLAIGDRSAPEMVNIHRLSPELSQNDQMDGLPVGTRGGVAIRTYLPLNGEYVVDVELTGRARDGHQVELSIDGQRVELVTLGGNNGPGTEFRIPIAAGPWVLGATFIERNQALGESTLLPQTRGRGTGPAIASVTIRGPYGVVGRGDTPTRDRIFVCRPETEAGEMPCAREILGGLAERAYRRPVSEDDLDELLPFYEEGRAEEDFDRGIQLALERLLVSPQFLFQIEREPEGVDPGTPFEVSDLELASRLSFFLWSSLPDDELIRLAAAGELSNPLTLEAQVRRMLGDPRAESLVSNFAAQWLFLRDVELKEPDPLIFRHFDETLRRAFERETELFVRSIFEEDRNVVELLTADYTFINERLAEHYGIPNIEGSEFRRVSLPEDSPRGGLLGQGSILTLTSYSTRTSPVLRGKYVLDNLLATPPPPPPADVPALETEAEPGQARSIREAMEAHRANPVCASCHTRMDPIGFAMENFDAIGRWRDTEAGEPVDATGVLTDGTPVDGVGALRAALAEKPERFVAAMTEKLMMFALGRNVQYYDRPIVRSIVREAAGDDYRFSSLVLGVVMSPPFQMRESAGSGDAE